MDQEDSLKAFITCSALLALKFWFGSSAIGKWKAIAGVRAPEDAALISSIPGAATTQDYNAKDLQDMSETEKKATEMVHRYTRVIGNDGENIPFTLLMALCCVMAQANADATVIMLSIFTLMRVLHTAFLVNAVQPWRTVVFSVGFGCSLGLLITALIAAFD
eukprot:GFYU01008659.1.p1 GENE.GFYU01008659.1~~GFYU01008659.1.p1  ORF type:complete len:162 (+),score=26.38 GFYU01008659.1:70-555(+)